VFVLRHEQVSALSKLSQIWNDDWGMLDARLMLASGRPAHRIIAWHRRRHD
jgi:hypothetical protein